MQRHEPRAGPMRRRDQKGGQDKLDRLLQRLELKAPPTQVVVNEITLTGSRLNPNVSEKVRARSPQESSRAKR